MDYQKLVDHWFEPYTDQDLSYNIYDRMLFLQKPKIPIEVVKSITDSYRLKEDLKIWWIGPNTFEVDGDASVTTLLSKEELRAYLTAKKELHPNLTVNRIINWTYISDSFSSSHLQNFFRNDMEIEIIRNVLFKEQIIQCVQVEIQNSQNNKKEISVIDTVD